MVLQALILCICRRQTLLDQLISCTDKQTEPNKQTVPERALSFLHLLSSSPLYFRSPLQLVQLVQLVQLSAVLLYISLLLLRASLTFVILVCIIVVNSTESFLFLYHPHSFPFLSIFFSVTHFSLSNQYVKKKHTLLKGPKKKPMGFQDCRF